MRPHRKLMDPAIGNIWSEITIQNTMITILNAIGDKKAGSRERARLCADDGVETVKWTTTMCLGFVLKIYT